jgi:acetyl esterase/lipase
VTKSWFPPLFGACCLAELAGCAIHDGRPDQAPPQPAHAEYRVREHVTYTPSGWPQALQGDLYQPLGEGPFPAVIVVHGGGWNSRDRTDMDAVSRKLAQRGYVALNIDYRLAPRFLFPASSEDVRAAIGWLRTHADELGVDRGRIGGWGYSAGAHLVALAATADAPAEARLQAVVAGGTPADLPHYPVSPIISRYIGAPFADARDQWLAASPVTHVDSRDPPMFLYHGSWDRLVYVEDAYTMKAALDRAGVPNELYVARGRGHIGMFLLGGGAESAGIEFLDRHLRKPAPANLRNR